MGLYNIGAMRLAKGANSENEQISARSGLGRGWLVRLLNDSSHSFGELESKMVKNCDKQILKKFLPLCAPTHSQNFPMCLVVESY